MKNLKNHSHYLAITTHCAKATIDPPINVVNEVWNDVVYIDVAPEVELEKLVTTSEPLPQLIAIDKRVKKDKGKGKKVELIVKTI